MTTSNESPAPASSIILPAIVAGGLLAGILDAAAAFRAFGVGMPYGIASGVLGSQAYPQNGGGGAGIWALGLTLHFVIAFGAAATYCLASRHLTFLREHFIFGGIVCGFGVWLTMNLVVLPASAVPFAIGPFSVKALRNGLFFLTLWVGLPISTSLWFFARRAAKRAAQVTV